MWLSFMIAIHRWNDSTFHTETPPPETLTARLKEIAASPGVVWIDLENPTPEEEHAVFVEFFKVHPLTLEDVNRLRRQPDSPHLPKVEEFRDYLFVVMNPLREEYLHGLMRPDSADGAANGAITQLSAILTKSALITHHYEPSASIRWIKNYLIRHETQGERGPDYLFHLVLDAIVDQFAVVLDHFDGALDTLEVDVIERPSQALFHRLLRLKREIILLRKTLVYGREVMVRLARGDFALVDEREKVYYRNVYDHLVRFTELIESSREMVSDLMQSYLAATSNRLNSIMKVLTMISTIILPMTLVAGIYGMNFKLMPELEQPWGYPFALIMMALVGIGGYAFFRWSRWV